MHLTTQIRDWWAVMLSLLGLAVWSVRFEARARTNTAALDRETARLAEEIRALERPLGAIAVHRAGFVAIVPGKALDLLDPVGCGLGHQAASFLAFSPHWSAAAAARPSKVRDLIFYRSGPGGARWTALQRLCASVPGAGGVIRDDGKDVIRLFGRDLIRSSLLTAFLTAA
ncbi:hypothetical protein [Rhodovulum sulfidophilum]|uniref:hypothetical protein n=1 Tax=Rhodovulum sulfidophilum TaxID=35806 RepID=UPI001F5CFC02|nr:hypothetical protein [Rhodovulum sulfidophilum]